MRRQGALRALRALARSLPPPPLQLVPFALQRRVLERALGVAFAGALADGELDILDRRRLRVTVTDLALCWDISHRDGGLRVLAPDAPPDVELAADFHSLVLLATRRADPDTLFFQRRLRISGDTELGLACKNLMDALEPGSRHPLAGAVLELVGRLAMLRETPDQPPLCLPS